MIIPTSLLLLVEIVLGQETCVVCTGADGCSQAGVSIPCPNNFCFALQEDGESSGDNATGDDIIQVMD